MRDAASARIAAFDQTGGSDPRGIDQPGQLSRNQLKALDAGNVTCAAQRSQSFRDEGRSVVALPFEDLPRLGPTLLVRRH